MPLAFMILEKALCSTDNLTLKFYVYVCTPEYDCFIARDSFNSLQSDETCATVLMYTTTREKVMCTRTRLSVSLFRSIGYALSSRDFPICFLWCCSHDWQACVNQTTSFFRLSQACSKMSSVVLVLRSNLQKRELMRLT